MARIFINYRRDDTPGVAGRLFDYLTLKFSRRELFMDVDAMKPGLDFAQQLDRQVSQCHVLLAVIGPRWLDARDRTGQRRLDAEKDYVRIELASALKRDIAVIPVLVDGATMPPEEALPDDLKSLARRHALELRHTRFSADADMIVSAVDELVPRSRMPWRYVVPAAGVLAVLVILGVLWPKFSTRLHPPAPAEVNVKPPALNPPVAAAPPAVAPAQSSAAAPPAVVPAPLSAAPPIPSTATAGLPPGVKLGELIANTMYRGSNLSVAAIAADPAACQAACRAETRCVVWTYTPPKSASELAHCGIKAVIPEQIADACCTSAIERVPAPELREPPLIPAGMNGAVRGIELEGGTYRYFGGADATPQACQAACQADAQCLAWDYVRPGIFSPDARCFLKNKDSLQVKSPCCVAGFERHVAAAATTPAAPAAAIPAAPTAGLPAGTNLGQRLSGIAMPGSTLHALAIAQDDPTACQAACRAEPRCAAWTYNPPKEPGQPSRCELKAVVPDRVANICCVSAVERAPEPDLREAPPVPATLSGALPGIDLPGGDYRGLSGAQANPEACQATCRADSQCLEWTYVRPGIIGPDAHCMLKNRTMARIASTCCVSGIERQAATSSAAAATASAASDKPRFDTNFPGSDYRHFALDAGQWAQCQGTCKAETECLAWTFVQPGVQGPRAQCWLKNKIPPAAANTCCISGIERAEGR